MKSLDKGEITPVKQDESLATYAPMLSKELCPIDFTKPVRKIHKQICGLSDWPCATTVLEGKRLKVYRSEIASTKPCGKPAGTVVDNSDFSVACSDGVIRFTQVQAEGSKRMDTADFSQRQTYRERHCAGIIRRNYGNARKNGFKRLLTRLENSGSYSNILLDEGLERSDLSPQDKKFAAALFYGVLERQITLDNIIREYSRNPKNKLGTEVRVILRMGLYQLLYMDSVPDNAAVDESVKLAKKNRNPVASGFVNAMLREFIRNDKKLPKGRNATEELSIEYSAPVWLTEKWTKGIW